jgi:hypothetical protein
MRELDIFIVCLECLWVCLEWYIIIVRGWNVPPTRAHSQKLPLTYKKPSRVRLHKPSEEIKRLM